jgi:plasmid maintenance system antidote protein VapI
MISTVVWSVIMTESYQTFWELQSQNTSLGKFFGRSQIAGMPEALDHAAVGKRLRTLRYYLVGGGFGAQTRFVARLGIQHSRWNNLERGEPLARDMAIKLVRAVPGLSLDWLWLGREYGLPQRLQRDLEEAEKAVTLEEDVTPPSSRKKSKTKKRA